MTSSSSQLGTHLLVSGPKAKDKSKGNECDGRRSELLPSCLAFQAMWKVPLRSGPHVRAHTPYQDMQLGAQNREQGIWNPEQLWRAEQSGTNQELQAELQSSREADRPRFQ